MNPILYNSIFDVYVPLNSKDRFIYKTKRKKR